MTIYQLVATFYDRLENRHVERSKKVFLDESMANEYKARFITIVGDNYGVHASRITIRIIELEVVE